MLKITQGDTADFNLTATLGDGTPFDLTGAVFTSFFRGPQGGVVSFPNSQHTANPDQVLFRGQFILSLSTDDTSSIPLGAHKELITRVVQESSVVYFHGPNLVTVLSEIPDTDV